MNEKIIEFILKFPNFLNNFVLKPWFCGAFITFINALIMLHFNKFISIFIIFGITTTINFFRDKIEKIINEERSILKIRFIDSNDNDMHKLRFNENKSRNNIYLNIFFNGKKNKLPKVISITCIEDIILDINNNRPEYIQLNNDNNLSINIDQLCSNISNQNRICFEEKINLDLNLDLNLSKGHKFKQDIIVKILDHEEKEIKNNLLSINQENCTLEVS